MCPEKKPDHSLNWAHTPIKHVYLNLKFATEPNMSSQSQSSWHMIFNFRLESLSRTPRCAENAWIARIGPTVDFLEPTVLYRIRNAHQFIPKSQESFIEYRSQALRNAIDSSVNAAGSMQCRHFLVCRVRIFSLVRGALTVVDENVSKMLQIIFV